jgi:beta-glucosidase
MAKEPRYQGAGSSKINPYRLDNAWDSMITKGIKGEYASGYSIDLSNKEEGRDEALLDEACRISKDKDIVYIFAGLPEGFESEAFDRELMSLPDNQNKLVEAICKVNPNVVVILACGAPIELPWVNKVKAVLLSYLGGEGSGSAIADILLGNVVPSGKLAETWPITLKDNPSYNYFPGGRRAVEYRESIYVGYRYYEKAKKPVLYPFGHGLSYTSFTYSNLKLSSKECNYGDEIEVSFEIKNTGELSGKEIALVFVSSMNSTVFLPEKELCAFAKVSLDPGEEKTVSIKVDTKSFAYYNTKINNWYASSGDYSIQVGAGSASIKLVDTLKLSSPDMPELEYKESAPSYYKLPSDTLKISDEEFTYLYGKEIPVGNELAIPPYDTSNNITDIKHTLVGRLLIRIIKRMVQKESSGSKDSDAMIYAMLLEMPFHFMVAASGERITERHIQGILDMANGHFLKGIWKLIKK